MRALSHRVGIVLTIGLITLVVAPAAWAQDAEPETGWADTGELGFVLTAGNAESNTLSFNNSLSRRWVNALFQFDAGGLRASTTTRSLRAVGTSQADFELIDESTSELTAANYYARGRYERAISGRLFWFAGAGWDRNTFAGIAHRYSFPIGVGHLWFDDEIRTLRTSYGITYTVQDNVVNLDGKDKFAGLRGSWDYRRQLSAGTTFESSFIADENLSELSDFRFDTVNSVAVAMTDRFALRVSLRLLFDNEPSLGEVSLELPDGMLTGESVFVPLDKLDTIFTIGLAMNF